MMLKISNIVIFVLLVLPCISYAVEPALRITDREIVEKLTMLETGQEALTQRLEAGQEALIQRIEAGQEALNQKIEANHKALSQRIEANHKALSQRIEANYETLSQRIEANYEALSQRIDDINLRIDDMNLRIDDLNQRITGTNNTMLALFGAMITILVAMFAYIAWDRRTMLKPVAVRLEQLEKDVYQELDLASPEGSKLNRLIHAMRELAKADEKVASVLRSFSLL